VLLSFGDSRANKINIKWKKIDTLKAESYWDNQIILKCRAISEKLSRILTVENFLSVMIDAEVRKWEQGIGCATWSLNNESILRITLSFVW